MATDINILIKATDQASPAIKKVEGEVKGLGNTAKSSSSMLGGMGNILKTGFTAALVGTAAAVGGLAFAFKDSFAAAKEAEDAQKQLVAVLTSTGGAAGVTTSMALDLANSLSLVTNYGDDTIVTGENMLLTFTNIGKDVFPRATETMLDMSQALGTDLKGSAVQLGKALNDPIAGISALSRVGVTFTEDQKAMIQSMMDTNDIAGAQTVILDELAKEFGGSAKALADPFTQLQNQWGEVQEAVGTGLIPIFTDLAKTVLPYVQAAAQGVGLAFQGFWDYLDEGDSVLESIKWAIYDVLPHDLAEKWADAVSTIQGALNTITGNIQNTMGWIKLAWDSNWGDIRKTWDDFATEMPKKQQEFWDNWHAIFGGGTKVNANDWETWLGNLFGGITRWAGFVMDLLNGFLGNWRRTTTAWHALTIGDWGTFWSTIGGNFTTAFNLFLSFVDIFNAGFKEKILAGLNTISQELQSWWQGIAAWWNSTVGVLFGNVTVPAIAAPNFAVVNPANVSGGGTTNSTTIHVNVNGGSDPYQTGQQVGAGVSQELRARGH